MSIASQITALTTDRNNIRTALVNKGVTAASEHGFDDFAEDITSISSGGGGVISVTRTADSHGGTVVEVTAVDISSDTVTAARLQSGYTAHDAGGNAITGSLIPGITPTGTIEINQNGIGIDVTNYASADVSVSAPAPSLQAKTNITPTESSQTISADSGYDGLSSVQINAISSTYIGSGVTVLDEEVIEFVGTGREGKSVEIPEGFSYGFTVPLDSGSATTPATTITANPTISVNASGLITATASATQSITPTITEGWVFSDDYSGAGTITVSGSNTSQLSTKAAATITPTTTNQTIASGTYLTGTQTISGDANLVAGNIISGKSIFGVNGSVVIQHYYTGSSAPSASLGVNGDIYLQT